MPEYCPNTKCWHFVEECQHSTVTVATANGGTGYLRQCTVQLPTNHAELRDWLDVSLPHVEAFSKVDTGLSLVRDPAQTTSLYYEASLSLIQQLVKATNELHQNFVAATDWVLDHPQCWHTFGFPPQFWPRALQSFARGDRTFSGRLDFSIREGAGIKCFEYNADSASCLMECGHTQGLWSKKLGLGGIDPGAFTESQLIAAWKNLGIPKDAFIHFLHDVDPEEIYHSLYVMSSAKAAGFACKNFKSVEGFSFDPAGKPLDSDGRPVRYIWKSWSYTTLFTEWMKEDVRRAGTPRVSDICLSEDVEALFEPLWTAIPASKAILPVLTDMYPSHPNLLLSGWELTPEMRAKGYVTKPISGRIGENISLFGPGQEKAEIFLAGRFERNTHMFQERCDLPSFNGEYVQVNTFVIDGTYGGTVLRVDKSPIMSLMSDIIALRVVMDDKKSTLPEPAPRGSTSRRRESVDGPDAAWIVPFGSVLGVGPGGIPAYSSYYKSVARDVYPTDACYRHEVNGIYYGQRFSGVEFARRWLIHVKGVTFPDVDNAYRVYGFSHLLRVRDNSEVPWDTYENPCTTRPQPGSVLVWGAGDEDLPHLKRTGHLAIVVEVSDDYVRVAEQNVHDTFWPTNQAWGRQLAATYDKKTGMFSIPTLAKGRVQGWKTLPDTFMPEPIPVVVDVPEVKMAEKLLRTRSMKPLLRDVSEFPSRSSSSASLL